MVVGIRIGKIHLINETIHYDRRWQYYRRGSPEFKFVIGYYLAGLLKWRPSAFFPKNKRVYSSDINVEINATQ